MRPRTRRSRFAGTAPSTGAIIACLVLAAAAGCLFLAACSISIDGDDGGSLGSLSGSGTPASKTFDYSGFSGVRVDTAFAATITQGDAYAVSVTVDDNLVEHLRVEVDGDTLNIRLDPDYDYSDTDLTATVTMPGLKALEVTGGSSADVSGFAAGDDLGLEVSGAGTVAFAGMRAGKVEVNVSGAGEVSGQLDAEEISGEVSGAGEVMLEGSATKMKLEASGAGKVGTSDYTVQDAELQLSGGAAAELRVTGTLNVEASGGARLDYYGSPTLGDMNVSGGAEVNQAGD